jgi:hypothetical protein
MQEISLRVIDFFCFFDTDKPCLSSPPPERLPRRAVRGYGGRAATNRPSSKGDGDFNCPCGLIELDCRVFEPRGYNLYLQSNIV